MQNNLLILKRADVEKILSGCESEIIKLVGETYLKHDVGQSALPHSVFLRFPNMPGNRIIALPAYLGGEKTAVAGIKWVASFPGNAERGLARASAIVALNSVETGFPEAILEASAINLCRTAASGALAAKVLATKATRIGLIGAGPVGYETLRFLLTLNTIHAQEIRVFDLNGHRAKELTDRVTKLLDRKVHISAVDELKSAMESDLVIFATTAPTPFISDPKSFLPGSTVLHISLRDIAPELLVRHRNFVDDLDHVNRENTSIHLASRLTKSRPGFIAGTLADVLRGRAPARIADEEVVIFSPFGLGILDIAVARFVMLEARRLGLGEEISNFFAPP